VFKVTELKDKIKTIKPGDEGWHIKGQLTLTPRAGFEINESCPTNYRKVLAECINYGWLKPVAYVKESEYIWEKLGE
jgi:hypothetical protein